MRRKPLTGLPLTIFFSRFLDEVEASNHKSVFSEEVNEAVFSIDKDKSLGLDGYTSLSYQECWDIIKDDLMKVFCKFHGSGIINKCTNATYIVLVPKKENVTNCSDFWPISHVSSLYKIITEVLYVCLRNVMGSFVSNCQGGFVKGRQITDDILVANELVDGNKRAKEQGLVCKVDLEKAYDRVDWDFLWWIMEKKGFGKR